MWGLAPARGTGVVAAVAPPCGTSPRVPRGAPGAPSLSSPSCTLSGARFPAQHRVDVHDEGPGSSVPPPGSAEEALLLPWPLLETLP